MKKTLAMILVGLLLSSGLISCSQDETTLETDTTQNPDEITNAETSYLDTLGTKDFGGVSFAILTNGQGSMPAFAENLTGDPVNDALYYRDVAVSEAYNVVIEYSQSNELTEQVINSAFSGDYCGDIFIAPLGNGQNAMSSAFRQGALYNLMEVPHLKLDQAWWSSLMYEQLQYNGKLFFTSGDMATASYYAPACTFMNLTVAENNNINADEIYQTVFDNAWTIDEMLKLTDGLKADLNGDGIIKPADDSYGVLSATVELTATEIFVGAGIRYCEIDEAGNFVINLNTEKVINVLNKLKQCFNEVTPQDDWTPFKNVTFKSDHALFIVHFVQSAFDLRDMESDFAILPMPKYNVEQESYMSYTNPHTTSYIAVPLIQHDIDRTGFIAEALEYLSVEMVRPTIYEQTLKGKISRIPECQKMLDIIFDTSYIDFNGLNNFGGSTQVMCDALFGDADLVSGLKAIENKMNEDFAGYISLFE